MSDDAKTPAQERGDKIERLLSFKHPPLKRLGAGGGKLSDVCPVCGARSYGYHVGRWKSCRSCGFDRKLWHLMPVAQKMLSQGEHVSDGTLESYMAYIDDMETLMRRRAEALSV